MARQPEVQHCMELSRAIATHCRRSPHFHHIRASGIYLTRSNLGGIVSVSPTIVDFSWSSINDEQARGVAGGLCRDAAQLRWFLIECASVKMLNVTGCHNLQEMAVTLKYLVAPPK